MSPVVSFPFSVVSFPFTRTVWMEWFMPRGQIVRQHWLCIYMLFTCHPRRAKCSLFFLFFRKIQALLTGPIVTNLVSCSKLYFWSRGPRMPHRAHSERLRFPRPIVLIIVAACGRSSSWSASVERDGSDHGGLLFPTCFPSLLPLFLRTVAVGLISRFCNHFYAWRGHRRVSANKTSYLIKSSIITLADRAF